MPTQEPCSTTSEEVTSTPVDPPDGSGGDLDIEYRTYADLGLASSQLYVCIHGETHYVG